MFLKKNRIFFIFLMVLTGKNIGAMEWVKGIGEPLIKHGGSFVGKVVGKRLPVVMGKTIIGLGAKKYYEFTESLTPDHTPYDYSQKIVNFNQQEVCQKYLGHPLVIKKQLDKLYDKQGNFKDSQENRGEFDSIVKRMFLHNSFLNIFGEVEDNEMLKTEVGGWGWNKGSKNPSYDEILSKKQNFHKNHVDSYFQHKINKEKILDDLKMIVKKELDNAEKEFDEVRKNFSQNINDKLTPDNLNVDLTDDNDGQKQEAFNKILEEFKEKIGNVFNFFAKNPNSDQFGPLYLKLKEEVKKFYKTEHPQKKVFLKNVCKDYKKYIEIIDLESFDDYKKRIIHMINKAEYKDFNQENLAENEHVKDNEFKDYKKQLIEQCNKIFDSVNADNVDWLELTNNIKNVLQNFKYYNDETKKAISEEALNFIDEVFKGKMPTRDELLAAGKNINLKVNLYFDEQQQNFDDVEKKVLDSWKNDVESIKEKNKHSFRRNEVGTYINKIDIIEKINEYIIENGKIQKDNAAFIAFKKTFEEKKKKFIDFVTKHKDVPKDNLKQFFQEIKTVSLQYIKDEDDLTGGAQDVETGIKNYEKSFEKEERQPRIEENTKNLMDRKVADYGAELVLGSLFSNPLSVGFALGTKGVAQWAHGKLKTNVTLYNNATTSVNNGTTYVYNKIKDNSSEETAKTAASIGKQGLTGTFMITLGLLFTKLLQKTGLTDKNEHFQSLNTFLNMPQEWLNKFLGLFVEKAVVPVANKVQDYTHIDTSRRK